MPTVEVNFFGLTCNIFVHEDDIEYTPEEGPSHCLTNHYTAVAGAKKFLRRADPNELGQEVADAAEMKLTTRYKPAYPVYVHLINGKSFRFYVNANRLSIPEYERNSRYSY